MLYVYDIIIYVPIFYFTLKYCDVLCNTQKILYDVLYHVGKASLCRVGRSSNSRHVYGHVRSVVGKRRKVLILIDVCWVKEVTVKALPCPRRLYTSTLSI